MIAMTYRLLSFVKIVTLPFALRALGARTLPHPKLNSGTGLRVLQIIVPPSFVEQHGHLLPHPPQTGHHECDEDQISGRWCIRESDLLCSRASLARDEHYTLSIVFFSSLRTLNFCGIPRKEYNKL